MRLSFITANVMDSRSKTHKCRESVILLDKCMKNNLEFSSSGMQTNKIIHEKCQYGCVWMLRKATNNLVGDLDIKYDFPVLPLGLFSSIKWQEEQERALKKDNNNNLCLRVWLAHQRSISPKVNRGKTFGMFHFCFIGF